MANIGAQPGNKNAAKGRMFADAINRALELPSRFDRLKRLEAIANKLVTMAEDGDIQAIREVADRLDGKPAQTIDADVITRHAFAVPSGDDTQDSGTWAQTTAP